MVGFLKDHHLWYAVAPTVSKRKQAETELQRNRDEMSRAIDRLGQELARRRQVEERLQCAAKEWRATFDSITDSVSIHDKDCKLLRVNKAYADAFKMKPEELIGKTCYELAHKTKEPIPSCPHKQTMATGKPVTTEIFEPQLKAHLQVSTSPIFDDKGVIIGSVHITRDITERKRMEERLTLTGRLASIGEMASGIAHELNNPLTSVIGFSKLLLDKSISREIRQDLEIVHREAERAATIVKNLLAFARKHVPSRNQVNISDIIVKVMGMRAYGQKVGNIRVITRFADGLPNVMADPFQLQQVFLNIIINAEYFMTEARNGGTLTVTTEEIDGAIKVSFTDDGPGILNEDMGRLFDPFFTTKGVGKGTGLGLSICHGIVTEHGGWLYARSKPGRGATFVVELPTTH